MSNRTFDRFTEEQFKSVLEETDYNFKKVDHNWTGEIVYETKSENGKFIMRIFSSLDKHTGKARDKGSDAIRTVVVDKETGRPVLGEKRTNRIKTWPKNLKQKIQNVSDRYGDIQMCNRCGSVMVIRENSENSDKFYGCSNYPDCKNTESID